MKVSVLILVPSLWVRVVEVVVPPFVTLCDTTLLLEPLEPVAWPLVVTVLVVTVLAGGVTTSVRA